jgi:hypothetical protein
MTNHLMVAIVRYWNLKIVVLSLMQFMTPLYKWLHLRTLEQCNFHNFRFLDN